MLSDDMRIPRAAVCTLGCKVNFYESEFFVDRLRERGVEIASFDDVCDIYIINSCTVTGESDRKTMQMTRRAVMRNPHAFIVVTGCMAQVDPSRLRSIYGVDVVVGNSDKLAVLQHIDKYIAEMFGKDNGSYANRDSRGKALIDVKPFEQEADFVAMNISATQHTRAIIKIEDGCDASCSYCIIPQARGPARSKPADDVVREAAQLVSCGYKEIILTGIELSAYDDLPLLLEQLDTIEGLERIRLGSLDPSYIRKSWTDSVRGISKLAPHFHISLQSGSTKVLNAMKRKYTAEKAFDNIMYLRSCFPHSQFFADIIEGFPSETEDDFAETVDFVRRTRFLRLHVFPYSKRADTVAARMTEQIPSEVKKKRCAILRDIQREIRRSLLQEIVDSKRSLEVLFETEEGGYWCGHSAEFVEVRAICDESLRGMIRRVTPISANCDFIEAIIESV